MALVFSVSRDEFLAGLASLQNVAGKKGTIAILSNVLIESGNDSLLLTATDLEIGIRNRIPAEILSPGTITLPAKKLLEIVRESEASLIQVEIEDNHWAKITAESAGYKLAGMPADEYPAFPEYDQENLVSLRSEIMTDLIDKTIYSVAQEGDSQFNLTGILVEKEQEGDKNLLRMVSSDGHRLSLNQVDAGVDLSGLKMERTIIIPRKGMQEIRKFCDTSDHISLCFEEKQAVVQTDHSIIVIRLMNGDFPNYRNIIQVIGRDNFMETSRTRFMNAMKKMNLFTEDRYNAVRFDLQNNRLLLSSQSMDIGSAKDEMEIAYSGPAMQIGFNGKYVVETLQVMSSETVKVCISSGESPCLIEGADDDGFLSVIMPMKI